MKINFRKLLEQYPIPVIRSLASLCDEKGSTCYISGGTVRDWFLGITSRDLDITVAHDSFAWAGELAGKLGGRFVPLDEEEDVARVVWQKISIDFSSFREGAKTIEEDLLKRDFTINSMAIPFPGRDGSSPDEIEFSEILDPAGGQVDLQNKIIRVTSPAVFISDPLRLLRAYRFKAAFDFGFEPLTEKKIQEHVHLLFLAAEERIAFELDGIMKMGRSIATIEAMHDHGVLEELFPELYRGVGIEQPSSHHLDVFEHGVNTLRYMENVLNDPGRYFPEHEKQLGEYLGGGRRRVLLKWAALFHDLGKPATFKQRKERGERITFYNHDREGARVFAIIADRFKWSRDDRDYVSLCIALHMWPFHLNNARRKTGLTPRAYLRLIRAVGEEFPGLLILAMADSLAGSGPGKPPGMEEDMAGLFNELEEFYRQRIRPVQAERLLTGNDLIAGFGLKPGPIFREIFDGLEDARVAGEVMNREEALSWVKSYLESVK